MLLPAALLVAMACQLVAGAWSDSLTFDEVRYIQAGTCAFSTRTIDLEVSNPPAHKLLAGAAVLLSGQRPSSSCRGTPDAFYPLRPVELRHLILAARIPIVLLALALAASVYLWTRALFGTAGAAVALAVMAFEPTLLAHGHLVTGDLPVTAAVIGCLAAHWRWRTTRRRRWLVIAGLAVGGGLLSKLTILVLVPIVAVAEVWGQGGPFRERVRRALPWIGLLTGVAWATVCVVYLPFRQTHDSWSAPLSWVAPPSWFASVADPFHATAAHVNYLNGSITSGDHPFRLYFLEALGLKTTLGLLVLTIAAAVRSCLRRESTTWLYLWMPLAGIVAAASAGAVDVGVRYVLPVYALMAVLSGSLLADTDGRRCRRAILVAGAAAASATSSLSQAPAHIGYFNELAGRHPEAYLSDSNIDWGQDAWRLRDWWMARGRPPLVTAYFGTLSLSHYGIASRDLAPGRQSSVGLLAVGLTRLTVTGDDTHAPYAGHPYTVLQNRTPLTRVGTSLDIVELAPARSQPTSGARSP